MTSGDVRKDLQMVKNLIESCLQKNMSKADAVKVILRDAEIQPAVTELVWQQLEEQNREFFDVYYIQLALKQQIEHFNELLEKQVKLMKQIPSTAFMPASDGFRMTQFQQNAGYYPFDQTGPFVRPQRLQPTMTHSLTYTDGASTLHRPTSFDFSSSTRNDFMPNPLHGQSYNSLRLMQGLDGGTIKTENSYLSESPIIFDADCNVVKTLASLDNASPPTLGPLEATSQPLNETFPDIDSSLYEQSEQIPKNFCFSELSAFSPTDLDNCLSSVCTTVDTDNFLVPKDGVEITENNKLETISIGDYAGSECSF